ncbi:hypothetical protein K491DRAFT_58499 [Lophiostoma macrostomum CBS 122681]|uniref:Uncharacterized protein n=1 Tax=Lophiostoma macrostomum CBS 122681 TaxID=1314788 RepID=A0A6A6TMA6_9PLEO|nr:hypothetical protein K491DRAFT_58499 [Lophiostoma macrostomum CBS 122681]
MSWSCVIINLQLPCPSSPWLTSVHSKSTYYPTNSSQKVNTSIEKIEAIPDHTPPRFHYQISLSTSLCVPPTPLTNLTSKTRKPSPS